ncbi:MAG: DUF166 family protein [Nitrososphaerales archaeon]
MSDLSKRDEILTLVCLYSDNFGERVIRNLINDPSFCDSCGLYCDFCKYGVYSYVRNVRAVIKLPSLAELPPFIENPREYMPKKMPEADLCIASGLHKDLLLELPYQLKEFRIKALIVPIEDFNEVPSGLRKQVEERCEELGLEYAFPKPFCSLEPSPNKPTVSRFVNELKIGRPLLEISIKKSGNNEVIDSITVRRSAPCGSTWYIARKLRGIELKRETLYGEIAKAHHSYPCTATMKTDPELKEPILHFSGYIIRKEFERALKFSNLNRRDTKDK